MAKTRAVPKKPTPRAEAARLGPGLHGATIELLSGDAVRVRTLDGTRVRARLADDVDPKLVEACLREGRTVMVSDTALGPTILGALQTLLPFEQDPSGKLVVRADEVRFAAKRAFAIEVGGISLRADEKGAVRLEGDRLTIDMSEIVRILSSRLELP